MKERPILFSTEMVQAIIEGRKTQTRRIVKASGKATAFKIAVMPDGTKMPFGIDDEEAMLGYIKCPYGKPGDRLWVRETFLVERSQHKDYYEYKADYSNTFACDVCWKPSIFMPREACRILLEVTDVRVEKLKDISEKDVIAEGVEYKKTDGCLNIPARAHYMMLWDSINGKDSHELNPWVWVISFIKLTER
jgi:hypothetical protein